MPAPTQHRKEAPPLSKRKRFFAVDSSRKGVCVAVVMSVSITNEFIMRNPTKIILRKKDDCVTRLFTSGPKERYATENHERKRRTHGVVESR